MTTYCPGSLTVPYWYGYLDPVPCLACGLEVRVRDDGTTERHRFRYARYYSHLATLVENLAVREGRGTYGYGSSLAQPTRPLIQPTWPEY